MSASKKKTFRQRCFASALGAAVILIGLEIGYRATAAIGWLPEGWTLTGERLVSFRAHIASGVRGMFSPKAFVGYALSGEGSNSDGFCDVEWGLERPLGAIRVACLGGSTTQDGQRPERDNTYPSFLKRMLSRRYKRDVEVMNFGVNGWTSAESLVNYSLVVRRYEPDVVIIHHAVNDVWPRLYPSYRLDYTHYRVPWEDAHVSWLDQRLIQHSGLWAAWRFQDQDLVGIRERVIRRVGGEPIPILRELNSGTQAGYRGNLESLCRQVLADGATPILLTMPYSEGAGGFERGWVELLGRGAREHNEVMREVASAEGGLLVDAAETFSSDPGVHDALFKDYVHLRPAGNRVKALLIADEIQRVKVFR